MVKRPRRPTLRDSLLALNPRIRRSLRQLGWSEIVVVVCWGFILSLALDRVLELPWLLRGGIFVALIFVLTALVRRSRRRSRVAVSTEQLATAAEIRDPRLEGRLLSALELPREWARQKKSGASALEIALTERAVREIGVVARTVEIDGSLDLARVRRWVGAAALSVVAAAAVAAWRSNDLSVWFHRDVLLRQVDWPRRTHYVLFPAHASGQFEVHVARQQDVVLRGWVLGVLPEEVRIQRTTSDGRPGGDLIVRVEGYERVPDSALQTWRQAFSSNAPEPGAHDPAQRDLRAGLSGYPFEVSTGRLDESTQFFARGGDNQSRRIDVVCHDRPRLEERRYQLRFPSYLNMPPENVENVVGDLVVPDGTHVDGLFRASTPLESAEVTFGDSESQPLDATVEEDTVRFGWTSSRTGVLEVRVMSQPWGISAYPSFRQPVIVEPDRAPDVTLEIDSEYLSVAPDASIALSSTASDDHGVSSWIVRRWIGAASEQSWSRAESQPDNETAIDLSLVKDTATGIDANGSPTHIRVQGTYRGEIDLRPLSLAPGDRIVLQAAAADNREPEPQWSESQHEVVTVVEAATIVQQTDLARVEIQEKLLELAAVEERLAGSVAGDRSGWETEAETETETEAETEAETETETEAETETETDTETETETETEAETETDNGFASGPASDSASGSSDSASAAGSASDSASGSSDSASASASASDSASGSASASASASASDSASGSASASASDSASGSASASSPPAPNPSKRLAERQRAVAAEARALNERFKKMRRALEANRLLDEATAAKYEHGVAEPLDELVEERLPRSAEEIEALSKSRAAAEDARGVEEDLKAMAADLRAIAENLAGSGSERELIHRLEMILELQRQAREVTDELLRRPREGNGR